MHRFYRLGVSAALVAIASSASPAVAEVVEAHDDHFITRAEAVVDASAKETWLALISPARWWDGAHTWSADAANLKLTPQAGGCFCETIPEVDEPGRFTLQGSVEHMRVIQAYPEVALRMSGALGPLQSEPVTGILTIALSEAEAADDGSARTRIVWEYNVGGKMRYAVPAISPVVDGVMTVQLTKLAEFLGAVELPSVGAGAPAEPEQDEPVTDEGAPDEAALDEAALDEVASDEMGGPKDAPNDEVDQVETISVDEAFEDMGEAVTSSDDPSDAPSEPLSDLSA